MSRGKDYDIDQIIREAQRNKRAREQRRELAEPPAPPAEPSAPPAEPIAPPAEPPAKAESKRTLPFVPVKADTPAPTSGETDSPPPDEEDDVKIYVPGKIKPVIKKPEKRDAPPPEEQITFDSLTAAAEPPASAADAGHTPARPQTPDGDALLPEPDGALPDWERRMEERRRSRAEQFALNGDAAAIGAEPPPPLPEVLDDFNEYDHAKVVMGELQYRRTGSLLRLTVMGAVEALLLLLLLVAEMTGAPPMDPSLYLTLHMTLLLTACFLGARVLLDGLSGLLRGRAGSDTLPAVALLLTTGHTALQFLNIPAVSRGDVPLYSAAAGLGILLCLLARYFQILRICSNFRFVSHEGEKYAACRIGDSELAQQIGFSSSAFGHPEVIYFQKARFLSGFLENSYRDAGCDRPLRRSVPVILSVALMLSFLYGFWHGGSGYNPWMALQCLIAMLCVGAPVCAGAGVQLALRRAASRLSRRGGLLVGCRALEQFPRLSALVVDAADVFPADGIHLHGIKTFSGARIDDAIMDAAAVCLRAGGPLASVFTRIIEGRADILQEADTLVYEQDMGLSGWVGGRRVLVGNRRLLSNHGVDVPSQDYEMRYTKDGRHLIYLSSGGELCAMFVLSYLADEQSASALSALTRAGIHLLVRTCDPNVTGELIAAVFGVDARCVEILDAASGRQYDKLLSSQQEETPALLAANGRLEGMAMTLAGCNRLRHRLTAGMLLQIIGALLGLSVALFYSLVLALGPLPPAVVCGWLGAWTVLGLAGNAG